MYYVSEHCDVGENVKVDPPSIFSLPTWVLVGWNVLPLFPLSIQLRYWIKIFWIINGIFWIIMMSSNLTWVNCRWCKLWLRSGWIFSSSSTVIFFHLYLQIIILVQTRHIICFFLCINRMIFFMGILHIIDMVIWVFTADWVHFWLINSNCRLSRSYVGRIIVFIEVLGSWSIFVIFLEELLSGWMFLYEQ